MIQSANDELVTVNKQLNLKINELNRVNDDLTNFLNASDIATVFLDDQLHIKRFTPAARKLFNFLAGDLRRPLGDVFNKFLGCDKILSVCKTVLKDSSPLQNEIQSIDGDWYLMRCNPYRTQSNKIDGVVLTFVNITDRKRVQLELQSLNQALEERVAERVGALRLLEAITRSANEATTIEEVLQSALGQTCKYLAWPLGHAYVVASTRQTLSSSGLWCSTNMDPHASFRKSTEGQQFGIGEGSPGRVLASGKSLWIADLGKDISIVRAKAAHDAGLRATLLIPVLVRQEVVAVLEFFASHVKEPDHRLLEVTEQIGIQIGRVFERKRAEARLKESERLAAVGTSTAKIAHEINNPLSNIYAAVQFLEQDLLQRKEPADGEILNMVTDIKGEVDRLSRLMNDLRTFLATGRQPLHREPVDIIEVAAETLRLEEAALDQHKIRLVQEFPADFPRVRGDRNKIKQVLVNLTRNAVEAMPDGGTLSVRVYQAGNQLVMEVADTGAGIPEDMNVLEQPVSTKRKGIGLGLLIVRQIITEHDGTLTYTTRPGQGTTFKITLPLEG